MVWELENLLCLLKNRDTVETMELILNIKTRLGGNNYLYSLGRLTPNDIQGARVWILYSDPNLEVNYIQSKVKELGLDCITVQEKDPIRYVKEKLSDNAEVVLWNENILLQPDNISKLRKLLNYELDTGFISGRFIEFPQKNLVDSIYSPKELQEVKGKGLLKIDVAFPYLFICKGRAFKELNFEEKNLFGLSLRKLGYQNYLTTDIEVGYE